MLLFGSQIIRVWLIILVALLWLTSCAGTVDGKYGDVRTTKPGVVTPMAFLDTFPQLGSMRTPAYTSADLVKTGSAYVPEYGANVSVPAETTQALFAPDFTGSGSTLDDTAYAIYAFHLEDYTQGGQFTLDITSPHGYSDLWLGLSNWSAGRWEWHDLSALTSPAFAQTAFSHYIDGTTDMLYAVVLFTGQDEWLLDGLSLAVSGTQVYPNEDARLGMNLSGVPDWGRGWVFVDVFKHSRTWISQPISGTPWDDGGTVAVDERGWVTSLQPGQVAGNVLLTSQNGNYPNGQYICLYDGEGTINFRENGSIVSQEPGRIVVDVDASNNGLVHLQITATNPADPVRNIRLIMPGYEDNYETQLFHPDYLASLEPFDVLRFMDWMETNGSTQQHWADRPTPGHHSQVAHGGVCVEYMVELSNRLGADPWFCMPHLADDGYVRQFATYVRDNLRSDLRVYIEHSNEVWNGIFDQAGYARTRGVALGLSDNDYQAQLFYHSRRSVEIFTIWEEVFGGTDRLVRVLASQHANPWTAEQVITFEDAYLHADALATAPYFGYALGSPDTADTVAAMGNAEILAACQTASADNAATTATNYAHADSHGLVLITYEGGQHLVGHSGAESNEALTNKLIDVNRDPGMRQVYLDDLNRWDTASHGGMFCAFSHIGSPSKWGSWGALEYQQQDRATAPKWLGLMDYLAQFE